MSRLLAIGAAAPLALGIFGGSATAVDPDDQAAADAAVAVFNERLTASGWTSQGPLTQTVAPDDAEESLFGACLGGFEQYLDYTDRHVEGETARAFSDDFESGSSDPESADAAADNGYAGAVVLTTTESAVGMLDTFIELLAAEETASCISQLATFAPTSDDSMSVSAAVTNQSGLGVGDASARLDFSVAMTFEGSELTSSATFAAARVDRSLVVVAVGGSGQAAGGLDPVAELAAMVATFG
jgi:hypothetical protein